MERHPQGPRPGRPAKLRTSTSPATAPAGIAPRLTIFAGRYGHVGLRSSRLRTLSRTVLTVTYRWAVLPHRTRVTCPPRGNWRCPHGDP
jgi:hypothetical protein